MRVVWESSAGAKRGLGYGPGASRVRVGNGPGAEAGAETRNHTSMAERPPGATGGKHIERLATLQSDPQGPLVRIQLVKLRRPRGVTVDTGPWTRWRALAEVKVKNCQVEPWRVQVGLKGYVSSIACDAQGWLQAIRV